MAVLRLIGAKRFMNKKASPDVILQGGLTNDIKDEKLINSLLNQVNIDLLKNEHPMFERVEEAPPVKKKSTRKKSVRTRKPTEQSKPEPETQAE